MLFSHNGGTYTSFKCGKHCVYVLPLICVMCLSSDFSRLVLGKLLLTQGLGLLLGPVQF